ncbi:MAG: hypothetical protein V4502_03080 [Pseudomonadota bacterium]
MKLSTMMFASILALAQGGAQDKILRSAQCPEGQHSNAANKGQAGALPAEAVNLNSSKSNAYRTGRSGGSGGPAEAVNLNSSKSNAYRTAGSGGGSSGPAAAVNLNSSKSNAYRTGGTGC